MIDRTNFFKVVRAEIFGSLNQRQVDGMNAILNEWGGGSQLTDKRWLAYMLGTTYLETAHTMWPIEEFPANRRGKPYNRTDQLTGKAYYGRGFVQLTWKTNYYAMGKKLGIDLVRYPEKALELPVASKILIYGMVSGTFTGRKLSRYFNGVTEDWENARQIINPKDYKTYKPIANHSRIFYKALS